MDSALIWKLFKQTNQCQISMNGVSPVSVMFQYQSWLTSDVQSLICSTQCLVTLTVKLVSETTDSSTPGTLPHTEEPGSGADTSQSYTVTHLWQHLTSLIRSSNSFTTDQAEDWQQYHHHWDQHGKVFACIFPNFWSSHSDCEELEDHCSSEVWVLLTCYWCYYPVKYPCYTESETGWWLVWPGYKSHTTDTHPGPRNIKYFLSLSWKLKYFW